ncbi:MAG: hypothetical protein ACM3OO_00390 [Planctomycetaceae bacterium]
MRRPSSALALALLALAVACGHDAGPYAAFRQAKDEAIPGTFDEWLAPPPPGSVPSLSPQRAYGGLPGAGTQPDVMATYAVVRNASTGSASAPSWVFITRDLCYFSAKGDLVSPARAGKADACTKDNLLVQIVDATTGKLASVFSAYDVSTTWAPARQGDPAQDGAEAGATRFH